MILPTDFGGSVRNITASLKKSMSPAEESHIIFTEIMFSQPMAARALTIWQSSTSSVLGKRQWPIPDAGSKPNPARNRTTPLACAFGAPIQSGARSEVSLKRLPTACSSREAPARRSTELSLLELNSLM